MSTSCSGELKRKSSKKASIGDILASVLLKLFINGKEICHTTDARPTYTYTILSQRNKNITPGLGTRVTKWLNVHLEPMINGLSLTDLANQSH